MKLLVLLYLAGFVLTYAGLSRKRLPLSTVLGTAVLWFIPAAALFVALVRIMWHINRDAQRH